MTFLLKPECDINDLAKIHPCLGIIFYSFCEYAYVNKLPVIVTSIIDDIKGRINNTHGEGRAIDISSRQWSQFHIERVCFHINEKFAKSSGAISAQSNIPRAIIHHRIEGGEYHFHLQVRKEITTYSNLQ